MGLLDYLNKAKDSAMAAKDKAVQYVKDNIQMREEASEEAKAWKTFDPKMLKAILNDNVSRAIDLYVKQTGASPEKARVLVNKISDSVKEEYPAILHEEACEADMQAIKDVWPFGSKVFNMYGFAKNKKEQRVLIYYGQLQSNGNGEYQLTAESLAFTYSWNAIFNNNKLYLKDESGNVIVADSFVIDLDENFNLVFNPKDERYKMMENIVKPINRIKTLHLFRGSDLERLKDCKMDKEAFDNIADKFTFKFKNAEIHLAEDNIGELFKDEFFRLSKKIGHPFILQQETYEYIHKFGVRYAPTDEDFQRLWRHFCQNAHPKIIKGGMNRERWNIEVLGEAGMIYSGLQKVIEQGSLPYKLDTVEWDNKGILYGFRIDDSFFDYFFGITDERPLINRIAGTVDTDTERMLAQAEEMQQLYQVQILANLVLIKLNLFLDSEKNVFFNGLGYDLGGFFDDVEFFSPSSKKKVAFETFANHINSSEPREEIISEPTKEKISEPTENKSDNIPKKTSEEPEVNKPIVKLYSFVKYRNRKTNEEYAYYIAPEEICLKILGLGWDIIRDFQNRLMSDESDLSQYSMGKSKGAIINLDGEAKEFEIIDVW